MTFIFISGQERITDNERADSFVRRAAAVYGRRMNQADILTAIRDTVWKEFLGNKLDSAFTMTP